MDYYNIIREELDLIDDAAELSDWDNQDFDWMYMYPRPVGWNGKTYSKRTPPSRLKTFCEANPTFCRKQLKIFK